MVVFWFRTCQILEIFDIYELLQKLRNLAIVVLPLEALNFVLPNIRFQKFSSLFCYDDIDSDILLTKFCLFKTYL